MSFIRRQRTWIRLATAQAVVLAPMVVGWTTRASYADPVTRTLYVAFHFRGAGFRTPAERKALLDKTQALFNNAGPPRLGGSTNLKVEVVEATSLRPLKGKKSDGTVVDAQIYSSFGSLAGDDLAGRAFKESNRCYVDRGKINAMFPGPNNAERRCRVYAEILAHEIGHTLCGTHQCKGSSSRKNCTGDPTILSIGTCIPKEKLGNNPSSLKINTATSRQIKKAIKKWDTAIKNSETPNWELKAAYFSGIVGAVNGVTYLDPVPSGDGTDINIPACGLNSFHYEFSGRTDLFQFGWLNRRGEFVDPLPEADNPDRVLDTRGGTVMNFAIRGWNSGPYGGQVFSQEDFGDVTLHGALRLQAEAETPEVTTDYFSQVTIDFVDIPGLAPGTAFSITLDSEDFSDDNGFYIANAPPPGGACCLMEGSCEEDVRPDECEAFSGIYGGDGTTCGAATCPEVTQVQINGPHPGPFSVGEFAFVDFQVLDQDAFPVPNAQFLVTSEGNHILFPGGQPEADGLATTIHTDFNGMAQIPIVPVAPGPNTIVVDVLGSLISNEVAFPVNDVPPDVRSDADGDSDVDGNDFSQFASCFNGAGKVPRLGSCPPGSVARFDYDFDGDIDGIDFSQFAGCFNKAGNPPRCAGEVAF